jgi:hypothetical protein
MRTSFEPRADRVFDAVSLSQKSGAEPTANTAATMIAVLVAPSEAVGCHDAAIA